jgi:hypothetical protein
MTDFPESRTTALSVFSAPTSFAALLQKGVERVADFQKIALDFYAHQTVGVIDSWKKMALPETAFPVVSVVDAAEQGLADLVALQKSLLDLLVQQSARGFEALRPEIPCAALESPNKDSIDVLIADQPENESAVAARMVDQIVADLQGAEKPVVQHVAVQQKEMRKAQVKKAGAAKQRNDW